MSKQKMINMLVNAKLALHDTGLMSGTLLSDREHVVDEGTKNLIGQLIIAAAIEEFGTEMTKALNNVASRIRGTSR